MTIRQARPEDAPEAAVLLYAALNDIAHSLTGATEKAEVMTVLEEFFRAQDNRLSYRNTIVKELNQRVVGVMVIYHGSEAERIDRPIVERLRRLKNEPTLTIDKETNDEDFYIDTLSVSEDCRRKGIGMALLRTAEEMAIKKKYHRLALNVEKENEPAIRLYGKVGYTPDSIVVINQKPFTYMVKNLELGASLAHPLEVLTT